MIENTTEPKVFVSSEAPKLDLSDAMDFGELIHVCSKPIKPYTTEKQWIEIHKEIKEMVKDYNPLTDYIIQTGNPIMISLVFQEFAKKAKQEGVNSVCVLQWMSRRKYVPIVTMIDLEEETDTEET